MMVLRRRANWLSSYFLIEREEIAMKKEEIKKWFSDHKKEIAIGTAGVVTFALGLYVGKKCFSKTLEKVDVTPFVKTRRAIDRDIFTDLASEIEDLVLAEGVDEGLVEKVYTVAFPKGGDSRNGYYGVRKYVKVLVQDTCEDVEL